MGPGIVQLKHLPLSFNNIEHLGPQHIVYNVEPLNFLGHVLGLFCICRILLPTSWRFHRQICQLPVHWQELNALYDVCIRGFDHHISGEENVTHRWTKFGASSSKSRPQCTIPTNTRTSVYLGQNWPNIRYSWANSAFAKPVADCLGVNYP